MEKTLINLYVPSIKEEYDIFVPMNIQIADLMAALTEGVRSMSNERYSISGDEVLVRTEPNAVLDPHKTMYECAVTNGLRLVMI